MQLEFVPFQMQAALYASLNLCLAASGFVGLDQRIMLFFLILYANVVQEVSCVQI
jgi:hypothetical protein